MKQTKRPGRPAQSEALPVAEALLRAAEKCLETKSYNDITVREIAAIAGVNQSMVNYYFENKAELYLDLIKSALQDQASRLKELEARIDEVAANPTRALVAALRDGLYRHRPIILLMLQLTTQRDPVLFASFQQRIASLSVSAFGRYIQLMIDRGVYRSDVDIRFLTFSVIQLATGPLYNAALKESFGWEADTPTSEAWFAYLEDALDRLLRPVEHLRGQD